MRLCLRKGYAHGWQLQQQNRPSHGGIRMSARPEEVRRTWAGWSRSSTDGIHGGRRDQLLISSSMPFSSCSPLPASRAWEESWVRGVVARRVNSTRGAVLAFLWDLVTASDGRNLLGQKEATSISLLGQEYNVRDIDRESRFVLQFSATTDGFYESPNGQFDRKEV